jgi:hypothetical protein
MVMLVMNDYIFVQFTKTSIYCILLSLYYLLYEENKRKRVFLFFIAGLLLRAEAFWLIFTFVIAIHLIYDRQLLFFKLKKIKIPLTAMLLIALAVSIFNKTVFNEDDARYNTFRPYKYTLLDFKQGFGAGLDKTDSIKLDVLQNYFFGDADTLLTVSTFKKLDIKPHERFNFFSKNNMPFLDKASREMHHILTLFSAYIQFYILWLVTWGIIIFFNLKKDGYRSLFKYTGVFTFTIFFIAIITVYIKMEARVLNPLLICTIFYSVLFTSSSRLYKIPHTQIFISSVLILLSGVYLSFTLYNKIAERHKFDTQAENFIKYWKEYNGEKILIPDVFSWEIFGSKVFKNYAEVNQMRMISLDDGYMSMMKTHREYMYSITGSTHFYDYLSYIDKNKNNICFLGTDKRMRLMSQYIEAVYKIPFHLIKSGNQPVVEGYGSIGHLKFYLYRLE